MNDENMKEQDERYDEWFEVTRDLFDLSPEI